MLGRAHDGRVTAGRSFCDRAAAVRGLRQWRPMTAAAPRTFTLQPHPATPCPALDSVVATLARDADSGAWQVGYRLSGDMARLRLPPPAPQPAATDGLWQHSCLELFVARAAEARYHEFNFSPSGDWAGYAFSAERVRDLDAAPLPAPRIRCERAARTLALQAWLPAAALPPGAGDFALGLTAVVESTDGSLSYWALAHPGARPDFHRRAGWTAQLPAAHFSSQITLQR